MARFTQRVSGSTGILFHNVLASTPIPFSLGYLEEKDDERKMMKDSRKTGREFILHEMLEPTRETKILPLSYFPN